MRALVADPGTLLLEVGPGNVLASLARLSVGKDASKRVFSSLAPRESTRSDDEALLEATGRLWMSGAPIDWRGFHAEPRPRRVPLPTYPFERKRHWVDACASRTRPDRAPHRGAAVKDWMFAPTWTRDDRGIGASRLNGSWLVVGGGGAG